MHPSQYLTRHPCLYCLLSDTDPAQHFSPFLQEEGGLTVDAEVDLKPEPAEKPEPEIQGDKDANALESSSPMKDKSKAKHETISVESSEGTPGSLLSSEANVNINKEDEEGFTPLHRAVKQGNLAKVKMLLTSGAIVNKENRNKETALHFAAKLNRQDIIKLLLSFGALLNHVNDKGKIPGNLAKDITLFKAAGDSF